LKVSEALIEKSDKNPLTERDPNSSPSLSNILFLLENQDRKIQYLLSENTIASSKIK